MYISFCCLAYRSIDIVIINIILSRPMQRRETNCIPIEFMVWFLFPADESIANYDWFFFHLIRRISCCANNTKESWISINQSTVLLQSSYVSKVGLNMSAIYNNMINVNKIVSLIFVTVIVIFIIELWALNSELRQLFPSINCQTGGASIISVGPYSLCVGLFSPNSDQIVVFAAQSCFQKTKNRNFCSYW